MGHLGSDSLSSAQEMALSVPVHMAQLNPTWLNIRGREPGTGVGPPTSPRPGHEVLCLGMGMVPAQFWRHRRWGGGTQEVGLGATAVSLLLP